MLIEQFAPRDRLKPFVRNYLVIESENGMQNKILPGTSIVLSFRIRGSVSFLLSRLRGPSPDPLIAETRRKIQAAGGRARIRELLQGMPISRDSFEKRFRTVVGTSPGRYAGIVRMRKLIDAYTPEKSLTEIAYQAGYFDQAHFIKDFRTFTGQTPGAFFAAPAAW